MDDMGLRWIDRRVIEALLSQPKYRRVRGEDVFVCYAASELNTCTLAGLDKGEYRESIRPRLMTRGLLEVKPYYGQALTEKAMQAVPRPNPPPTFSPQGKSGPLPTNLPSYKRIPGEAGGVR
jgi:hypothetical protein